MSSTSCMNELAFVDVQGFKDINNNFILKEVHVHTVAKNLNYHAIIHSPFPFHQLIKIEKQQVRWVTKNYHGIRWDEGNISLTHFLDEMNTVLREKTIIFRGVEKVKWLQFFFERITIKNYCNCEDLNCNLKLSETHECFDKCVYHRELKRNIFVCAFENVMKLKQWYIEEYIE